MGKKIKSGLIYAITTHDIWLDLKEMFEKEIAHHAYELIRKITATYEYDISVSTFYKKLRGVWDEIQSISPSPCVRVMATSVRIPKNLQRHEKKIGYTIF